MAHRSWLIGILALVAARAAHVSAAPIAVEDFFRNPEFTQMRLSPDGQWLAALAPVNGRRNLAVLRISERQATAITNAKSTDIGSFFWATNDRLVYSVDVDGNEAYGLYAIDRDGKNWRELAAPAAGIEIFPHSVLPLDRLRDDPDHILVTDNERQKLYPDVIKLDINTGRGERVVPNPGFVTQWITDHAGRVRAGIGNTDDPRDLRTRVVYRGPEAEEWEILTEYDQFDDHGWVPLAFAADNRTLYVSSNIGRDTSAIYEYDPETRTLGEMIFGHDRADVADVVLSPLDYRLLAVNYEFEKPETEAIDTDWAALREAIDSALPDTLNAIVSMSEDERRLLVLATSDRDPGGYYLLDRDASRLEYIASRMGWIKPGELAAMEPVSFTARDGVELHGYLTRPPNADGAVPLIINPHGGPYGIRDSWRFNPEVQFLASRGYAVLQVNYRGSGGYGKHFRDIAWRRWGLEMQDDLTDAVAWAVDQGIADPERVCIYGASYGGYATLMGLTKTPELYRCGIDYVGVVNLLELHDYWSSSALGGGALEAWFGRAIGDPRSDKERLTETSPINEVDKIDVPLLVVHGRRDPRVPVDQANELVRALKRNDDSYELLIKPNEGHGFQKEENKFELYKLMERFLADHLAATQTTASARQGPGTE